MRALPWILTAGVVGVLALTASSRSTAAPPPDKGGGAGPAPGGGAGPAPGGRPACDPALLQLAVQQLTAAQAEILNVPAAVVRTSPAEMKDTAARIDACAAPAGLGPVPTQPLSDQLRSAADALAARRATVPPL